MAEHEGTPPARDPGDEEDAPELFGAIVHSVLDDERFVDSVKHFIGKGDSLLLRSSEPVDSSWVAVMDSSDGSSIQLIGPGNTLDYYSNGNEVFLKLYPTKYMRQLKRSTFEMFLDRLPAVKLHPDELGRLEAELERQDLVVDQPWLAERPEGMPFTIGRPAGEPE